MEANNIKSGLGYLPAKSKLGQPKMILSDPVLVANIDQFMSRIPLSGEIGEH